MKKAVLILIFMLIITVITTGARQTPAFALTSPPELTGETAVLIDTKTGDVLFDKNKDALREPASTTKIMTALLTLENLPLDKVLTIDAESPFTGGSRIYIVEGEELTVEQLLYALLLESANDTAVALAIAISGSVQEFVMLMNDRARELGAKNPRFENPNGLHSPGHFISAYDLALIAREAMKNQDFRKIVSTVNYTIPETNKQPERAYIHNTNRLLSDSETKVSVKGVMTPVKYEGVTGVKTGYTPQAGGTLVASAERDGTELIAVVLASTDMGRFADCISLLDYGFDNFYTYKAVDSNAKLEDIPVKRGVERFTDAMILDDRYITLPREASLSLITTKVVIDEDLTAPVEAGQIVGRIEIYEGGDMIGEVPVAAVTEVAEGGFLTRLGIDESVSEIVRKALFILTGFIGFLLIVYIVLKIRRERRRKAKRASRALEIAKEREQKRREAEQRRWPY